MINETGNRYGRLLVLSRTHQRVSRSIVWLCRCDCGNIHLVNGAVLRRGGTRSCGCLRAELHRQRATTHGKSKKRIYAVWNQMIMRCENEKHNRYYIYGGRGITVCAEWHVFEQFFKWAVSNGYSDKLFIDRIDNNEGYSPDNCRFTTRSMNARNSSYAKVWFLFGRTFETCKEAAGFHNVCRGTIRNWCKSKDGCSATLRYANVENL